MGKTKEDGVFECVVTAGADVGPGWLARVMQQATEAHMAACHMDWRVLGEQGLLWVIAFSEIQVERMPKPGEQVTVLTWPSKPKYGMSARKFELVDGCGDTLAKASSLFPLVDATTREMVPIVSEVAEAFPPMRVEGELPAPALLKDFPQLEACVFHNVSLDEIDKNGHVNNAFYLDWAEEIGDAVGCGDRPISSIWIEYLQEVLPGETVELNFAATTDALWIKGRATDHEAFSVSIVYAAS